MVFYRNLLTEPSVSSSPASHTAHETQARQVLTGYTHRAVGSENCHMSMGSGQLEDELDGEEAFYFYCRNYIDWARKK